MRKLLLGTSLLAISFMPSVAGSGTYGITETVYQRIEFLGDKILVSPQNPTVRDIALFAIKDGKISEQEALEFGHALSNTFAPKRLAAIASKEAHFNKNAIGPDGHDRGAFQVRDTDYGKAPSDIYGQVKQAERALLDKLADAKGNLDGATIRYNGFGYKSRLYAADVKRIERKIRRQS